VPPFSLLSKIYVFVRVTTSKLYLLSYSSTYRARWTLPSPFFRCQLHSLEMLRPLNRPFSVRSSPNLYLLILWLLAPFLFPPCAEVTCTAVLVLANGSSESVLHKSPVSCQEATICVLDTGGLFSLFRITPSPLRQLRRMSFLHLG